MLLTEDAAEVHWSDCL